MNLRPNCFNDEVTILFTNGDNMTLLRRMMRRRLRHLSRTNLRSDNQMDQLPESDQIPLDLHQMETYLRNYLLGFAHELDADCRTPHNLVKILNTDYADRIANKAWTDILSHRAYQESLDQEERGERGVGRLSGVGLSTRKDNTIAYNSNDIFCPTSLEIADRPNFFT